MRSSVVALWTIVVILAGCGGGEVNKSQSEKLGVTSYATNLATVHKEPQKYIPSIKEKLGSSFLDAVPSRDNALLFVLKKAANNSEELQLWDNKNKK